MIRPCDEVDLEDSLGIATLVETGNKKLKQ